MGGGSFYQVIVVFLKNLCMKIFVGALSGEESTLGMIFYLDKANTAAVSN